MFCDNERFFEITMMQNPNVFKNCILRPFFWEFGIILQRVFSKLIIQAFLFSFGYT